MRWVLLWLSLALPAQGQEAVARFGPATATTEILVRSTTDITVFGPVMDAFLATVPGLAVRYEQWGSNNLYDLSLADCGNGQTPADAVISSGVQQMVALVNASCAAPYRSAGTQALSPALRWRDELWGITREPAVMVYNRAQVPPAEVPRTRFDLLDLLRPENSRYGGRVATYDIETSGLGYLFAFMDSREATTFGALLESLGRSGAVATCCSAEIIGGVAEGRYLLAYNVLGSYALAIAQDDDRIGIAVPQDYTLVLSRALMIPRGAQHPAAAQALLEYVLSPGGQAALTRALLIAPLLDGGEEAMNETALRPIGLTPSLLVAMDRQKREGFIRRWRETFPGP
ncbi:ABC transporter substrate-binding protein [Puniceibacterium sp. IMCC21224]|uniref:ABC transporter substrate-binding protein n=1 Tax=Puniceibacterium sp. IMCC21224 TaxID=1618204 RepID=UPI00064DD41B|nr:ABC transporter substrate-binding protein [Puniceibacterium sp. IMCC21224]KMK66185.1 ABC-type Fe3+ transport system, periplasmic component [Puniceibacterium sp. IMCC21224]